MEQNTEKDQMESHRRIGLGRFSMLLDMVVGRGWRVRSSDVLAQPEFDDVASVTSLTFE